MTALAGAFFVNLTAQFASSSLADIQGGLGASANEASWATTAYVASSFIGIILSGALATTFGLRRYFVGSGRRPRVLLGTILIGLNLHANPPGVGCRRVRAR